MGVTQLAPKLQVMTPVKQKGRRFSSSIFLSPHSLSLADAYHQILGHNKKKKTPAVILNLTTLTTEATVIFKCLPFIVCFFL